MAPASCRNYHRKGSHSLSRLSSTAHGALRATKAQRYHHHHLTPCLFGFDGRSAGSLSLCASLHPSLLFAMSAPPKKTGLSLYADLLEPNKQKSQSATISGAAVKYDVNKNGADDASKKRDGTVPTVALLQGLLNSLCP